MKTKRQPSIDGRRVAKQVAREDRISCVMCNKGFQDKRKLEDHMKLHTLEKPFFCLTCGKQFSRLVLFKNHSQTHEQEGVGEYECSKCNTQFRSLMELNCHVTKRGAQREILGCRGEVSAMQKIDDITARTHVFVFPDSSEPTDNSKDVKAPVMSIDDMTTDVCLSEKKSVESVIVPPVIYKYQCTFCPEIFDEVQLANQHHFRFHHGSKFVVEVRVTVPQQVEVAESSPQTIDPDKPTDVECSVEKVEVETGNADVAAQKILEVKEPGTSITSSEGSYNTSGAGANNVNSLPVIEPIKTFDDTVNSPKKLRQMRVRKKVVPFQMPHEMKLNVRKLETSSSSDTKPSTSENSMKMLLLQHKISECYIRLERCDSLIIPRGPATSTEVKSSYGKLRRTKKECKKKPVSGKFKCGCCGQHFAKLPFLRDHVCIHKDTDHTEPTKKVCGTPRQRIPKGALPKKYNCASCPRTFSGSFALRAHQRAHESKKPLQRQVFVEDIRAQKPFDKIPEGRESQENIDEVVLPINQNISKEDDNIIISNSEIVNATADAEASSVKAQYSSPVCDEDDPILNPRQSEINETDMSLRDAAQGGTISNVFRFEQEVAISCTTRNKAPSQFLQLSKDNLDITPRLISVLQDAETAVADKQASQENLNSAENLATFSETAPEEINNLLQIVQEECISQVGQQESIALEPPMSSDISADLAMYLPPLNSVPEAFWSVVNFEDHVPIPGDDIVVGNFVVLEGTQQHQVESYACYNDNQNQLMVPSALSLDNFEIFVEAPSNTVTTKGIANPESTEELNIAAKNLPNAAILLDDSSKSFQNSVIHGSDVMETQNNYDSHCPPKNLEEPETTLAPNRKQVKKKRKQKRSGCGDQRKTRKAKKKEAKNKILEEGDGVPAETILDQGSTLISNQDNQQSEEKMLVEDAPPLTNLENLEEMESNRCDRTSESGDVNSLNDGGFRYRIVPIWGCLVSSDDDDEEDCEKLNILESVSCPIRLGVTSPDIDVASELKFNEDLETTEEAEADFPETQETPSDITNRVCVTDGNPVICSTQTVYKIICTTCQEIFKEWPALYLHYSQNHANTKAYFSLETEQVSTEAGQLEKVDTCEDVFNSVTTYKSYKTSAGCETTPESENVTESSPNLQRGQLFMKSPSEVEISAQDEDDNHTELKPGSPAHSSDQLNVPTQCPFCSKGFTKSKSLYAHISLHIGEKSRKQRPREKILVRIRRHAETGSLLIVEDDTSPTSDMPPITTMMKEGMVSVPPEFTPYEKGLAAVTSQEQVATSGGNCTVNVRDEDVSEQQVAISSICEEDKIQNDVIHSHDKKSETEDHLEVENTGPRSNQRNTAGDVSEQQVTISSYNAEDKVQNEVVPPVQREFENEDHVEVEKASPGSAKDSSEICDGSRKRKCRRTAKLPRKRTRSKVTYSVSPVLQQNELKTQVDDPMSHSPRGEMSFRKTKRQGTNGPRMCDQCGNLFCNKASLTRHINHKHNDKETDGTIETEKSNMETETATICDTETHYLSRETPESAHTSVAHQESFSSAIPTLSTDLFKRLALYLPSLFTNLELEEDIISLYRVENASQSVDQTRQEEALPGPHPPSAKQQSTPNEAEFIVAQNDVQPTDPPKKNCAFFNLMGQCKRKNDEDSPHINIPSKKIAWVPVCSDTISEGTSSNAHLASHLPESLDIQNSELLRSIIQEKLSSLTLELEEQEKAITVPVSQTAPIPQSPPKLFENGSATCNGPLNANFAGNGSKGFFYRMYI